MSHRSALAGKLERRGLPAQGDLDRIFDEFVQAGPDHKNTQACAGLGLPLANRLVQAMGGTIGATRPLARGAPSRFGCASPERGR